MHYQGRDVLELMIKAKNYNRVLTDLSLKYLNANDINIVDFGAGIGTFSEILRERGFNVTCIETDPEQLNTIKGKNFEAYETILALEDSQINNVVSYNVFEHIPNDDEIFAQIYQKMAKGGKFFIFVPACQNLYSEFDKKLGHFRRYELAELSEKVESCGFKIVHKEYFDSLGFVLALFYKFLYFRGKIPPFSILVFDKILFPISRFADKYFSSRFGKNIAIIVEK
jgi:SAM-dependent methyltransferase